MNLKTAGRLLLFLIAPVCLGQQCPSGQIGANLNATPGILCAAFAQPTGQEIVALNQTAAIAAQTICDTSNTCPAGLYILSIAMDTVTAGTLISAASANVTYTNDVRTYTGLGIPTCGSLSLIVTNSPISCFWTFYHAANTAITVNTTVVTLTGSPVYNFRARINLIGNQ